jgi:hypothetical protein
MESETDDQALEKIISIRKKIKDVVHDIRGWMSEDGPDQTLRLDRLYSYASRQLQNRGKEMSSELTFTLFCACADSIVRVATSLTKGRDDWEQVLKQLLRLLKAQGAHSLEKYQMTLKKVGYIFSLFCPPILLFTLHLSSVRGTLSPQRHPPLVEEEEASRGRGEPPPLCDLLELMNSASSLPHLVPFQQRRVLVLHRDAAKACSS